MRGSERVWLEAYDASDFPPFALTVDLTILTIRDGVLCVLLVQRNEPPFRGWWALPGGHVRHGHEDADAAARRELREETGLAWTGHLEQVRTYSDPRRDPRIKAGLHVASISYVALAPDLPEPAAGTDAAAARWWPIDDDIRLAFDHRQMLVDGLERVRAKIEYTTLATQFVTEPFSLSDLRRVYAAIWGAVPDLANFRRKVLSIDGFVEPAEAWSASGGRPAQLYRRGRASAINPPFTRP